MAKNDFIYTQAQRDDDIEAAIEGIETAHQRHLKIIFDDWRKQTEQVYAIASAIQDQLEPQPGDGEPRIGEWRLAQVITEILGSLELENALKSIVGYREDATA